MDVVKTSKDSQSQPIIITGMHRSGTSLTASILQRAGINIGRELLGPGIGNIKGHFEDVDFWKLHQEILVSQGVSPEGWTTHSKISVPQQFLSKARALRDQRMEQTGLWGWKEPRTTLFLDFWDELIPEAKYIFVYRSPWEVVDSLFTRGDVAFTQNPGLAIGVWIAYNTGILDFYKQNFSRAVLIHIDNLKGKAPNFLSAIQEKLQLKDVLLEEEIFDSKLVHREASTDHRPALIAQFYPKAIEILDALNAIADLPAHLDPNRASARLHIDWALQDWAITRRAMTSKQQTQTELQQTQTELQQTQTELQQTQTELQQTQTELQQTQTELQQTQTELQQTQTQLHYEQELVTAMESSKFWKIRQVWKRAKSMIGLDDD
ncbi:MAG: chromosome partitioning protein ParA [Leptolyngbya sp. SIO1D8]|nr:chromosome partitioning protein ParA [Leptolyngbya sp. SIO1D8]